MPPASIRTPSKKNIAALPETSRLAFLLAASQLLVDIAPQASSHMGCQALKVELVTVFSFASHLLHTRLIAQWADTKQLPLPRGSVAQLCRQCGAHCTSIGAVLVKISRAQRRQKLQGTKHTLHR